MSSIYSSENNDDVVRETVTFQFGSDDQQVNTSELSQTIASTVQTILNGLNINSPSTTLTANNSTTTVNTATLDDFDCSICKDLLCEPIILMCQHSFCFECIQKHNNKDKPSEPTSLNPQPYTMYRDVSLLKESSLCPLCKFPFTLPPKYNNEFENLLSYQFPDEYKERKEMIEVNRQRDEMEEKMRKEVWNIINKNPPIEDKYWNINHINPQMIPIRNDNYRNMRPEPSDIELDNQSIGFFSKTWSVLSSVANSSVFQGIAMVSISLPCALFISKKMGIYGN